MLVALLWGEALLLAGLASLSPAVALIVSGVQLVALGLLHDPDRKAEREAD